VKIEEDLACTFAPARIWLVSESPSRGSSVNDSSVHPRCRGLVLMRSHGRPCTRRSQSPVPSNIQARLTLLFSQGVATSPSHFPPLILRLLMPCPSPIRQRPLLPSGGWGASVPGGGGSRSCLRSTRCHPPHRRPGRIRPPPPYKLTPPPLCACVTCVSGLETR
jgi:hypothetical protein